MANEFDLNKITAEVFGYEALPFPLLGLKNPLPDVLNIGASIIGANHLGVPYFMDLVIDDVVFPNEPLMTFSKQKRIVETPVVGAEGTVKELISSQDYRIKIEGLCIDPNKKEYPRQQVEDIQALFNENRALEISNRLCALFGIQRIVLKNIVWGKMKGQPYSQSFSIDAVSDRDFYATLKFDL